MRMIEKIDVFAVEKIIPEGRQICPNCDRIPTWIDGRKSGNPLTKNKLYEILGEIYTENIATEAFNNLQKL